MRRLSTPALALVLSLIPAMAPAQPLTGIDWQLLAIDGVVTDISATLRLEPDGGIAGAAPCNRWSTRNTASLPTLTLGGIRATRMACYRPAEEQQFFDTLSAMTRLEQDGSRNLVLTGPEGRSMEFVIDRMNSLTRCKTCPSDE